MRALFLPQCPHCLASDEGFTLPLGSTRWDLCEVPGHQRGPEPDRGKSRKRFTQRQRGTRAQAGDFNPGFPLSHPLNLAEPRLTFSAVNHRQHGVAVRIRSVKRQTASRSQQIRCGHSLSGGRPLSPVDIRAARLRADRHTARPQPPATSHFHLSLIKVRP